MCVINQERQLYSEAFPTINIYESTIFNNYTMIEVEKAKKKSEDKLTQLDVVASPNPLQVFSWFSRHFNKLTTARNYKVQTNQQITH